MTEIPPLTPADCDLRGLPFMQLDVIRLIDSDLFALSTGDEFKAAVALWCKSWLQVPAASLPDDDRVLAHLSGAGSRWKRVKTLALRGWVKCSDGRLYHPTVAEKALHAWKARTAQRARAAKRWHGESKSDGNATASDEPMPRHSRGTSQGNAIERERERESNTSSLRSDGAAAASPGRGDQIDRIEEVIPPDARTVLFSVGLEALQGLTGKSLVQCRSLLGKWLKIAKDDASLLNPILLEAAELRPASPVAWIEKAVQVRCAGGGREAERERNRAAWLEGEMLEGF